ncbi:MAG: phytanoyl-CoA dioxygenase family protein [Alphaproteobacteria bacterium]|nr:phytanoyl-CoA dioxygenase family protein [Alphaproteobacteria bacterium]
MAGFAVSAGQRADYERDGFFIARALFDAEEVDILKSALENDPNIQQNFFTRTDNEGGATKLVSWNHPGDSVYGLVARCRRVVDTMETLLDGEVYHYHSKLSAKEPGGGGSWEWHQDYGYWYHNGCLQPLMASVMVAIDRATPENGCLKMLKGSHAAGRIDHNLTDGDQVCADPERLAQLEAIFETVDCALEPGDAVFFHCNTLHRSDQNRSAHRRYGLLCHYNAARNNPVIEHNHPFYTKLDKVPDDAIKRAGMRLSDGIAEDFKSRAVNPPEIETRAK